MHFLPSTVPQLIADPSPYRLGAVIVHCILYSIRTFSCTPAAIHEETQFVGATTESQPPGHFSAEIHGAQVPAQMRRPRRKAEAVKSARKPPSQPEKQRLSSRSAQCDDFDGKVVQKALSRRESSRRTAHKISI